MCVCFFFAFFFFFFFFLGGGGVGGVVLGDIIIHTHRGVFTVSITVTLRAFLLVFFANSWALILIIIQISYLPFRSCFSNDYKYNII